MYFSKTVRVSEQFKEFVIEVLCFFGYILIPLHVYILRSCFFVWYSIMLMHFLYLDIFINTQMQEL